MLYEYASSIVSWLYSWIYTPKDPDVTLRYYISHNLPGLEQMIENFQKKEYVLDGGSATEIRDKSRDLHERQHLDHTILLDSTVFPVNLVFQNYQQVIQGIHDVFGPDEHLDKFFTIIKDVSILNILEEKPVHLAMYCVSDVLSFIHILIEKSDNGVRVEYYLCRVIINVL